MDKRLLPEFRVTPRFIGIDPRILNGYYVRAENETEAAKAAIKAGMYSPLGFNVERWKEPLY